MFEERLAELIEKRDDLRKQLKEVQAKMNVIRGTIRIEKRIEKWANKSQKVRCSQITIYKWRDKPIHCRATAKFNDKCGRHKNKPNPLIRR